MLIGLPGLAKDKKLSKIVINRRLPNKLIFPICFCKRETFYNFFYKFDKFEIDF